MGRRSGEFCLLPSTHGGECGLGFSWRRIEGLIHGCDRITNGVWSDYATMAVRTGGKGAGGLTLLVVPLKAQGVDMRRLKVTGSKTGGTTFIELEDVKVPAENIIGEEGKGMFYVMNNL